MSRGRALVPLLVKTLSCGAVIVAATLWARQEELNPGLPLGPYARNDQLAENVSIERAAVFLDTVATNWGEKHGCVTCHTNGYYLTGPADVFAERPAFVEARAFAEGFVDSWSASTMPDTEVFVATSAFLAIGDAEAGRDPSPATIEALGFAWRHQSEEGHWPQWVKCNWPPFESDDHFGVTLMTIAVGMSSESYRKTEAAVVGLARLRSYLERHPPTHLHHKAMLLWADSVLPDLLSDDVQSGYVAELSERQRSDGGFASGDLGVWRQLDGAPGEPPVNVESDGYGTGFVAFVLMRAGVPSSDPRIDRAINWLTTHQRAQGHWWTQSLRNEPDTSNFLTHAGTTFAVKALSAAGHDD